MFVLHVIDGISFLLGSAYGSDSYSDLVSAMWLVQKAFLR